MRPVHKELSPHVNDTMTTVNNSFAYLGTKDDRRPAPEMLLVREALEAPDAVNELCRAVEQVVGCFDELKVLFRSTDTISRELSRYSLVIKDQYASLRDNAAGTMKAKSFSESTREIQRDLAIGLADAQEHLNKLQKWSEDATRHLRHLADLRISEARAVYIAKSKAPTAGDLINWVFGTAKGFIQTFKRSEASPLSAEMTDPSDIPEIIDPMHTLLYSVTFFRYRFSTLFKRMSYGFLTSKMAQFDDNKAFKWWEDTWEAWESIRLEIIHARSIGE